jgi:hypothetical protein
VLVGGVVVGGRVVGVGFGVVLGCGGVAEVLLGADCVLELAAFDEVRGVVLLVVLRLATVTLVVVLALDVVLAVVLTTVLGRVSELT